MTGVEVVRVFVGADGEGGSPLGVVYDGASVREVVDRQQVARRLGFSETVFVDEAARGQVDIYTPSVRLPFAGYPLVGTAWLLRRHGVMLDVLRAAAGDVATWVEGEFTWIRGRAEWVSGKRTRQFASVAQVDALPAPPAGEGWLYAWAWADESAGAVRARGFPRRGDAIIEDEVTGAAAILLTGELRRDLRVSQGKSDRGMVADRAAWAAGAAWARGSRAEHGKAEEGGAVVLRRLTTTPPGDGHRPASPATIPRSL